MEDSASPEARIVSLARVFGASFLVAAASVLCLVGCLPLLPWRGLRVRLCCWVIARMGPSALRLLGVRLSVSGRERLGAQRAIYVINHTSTLDTFVSFAISPPATATVVKREVARVPVFGQAYQLSGHLLLERGDRDRAVASLRALADTVARHRLSVWIVPEGTRSRTGELGPFKKGFVHLAVATGLPIVPVVIHGAHHRWPMGPLRLSPGRLRVDVLSPVETTRWRREAAAEHAEQVRQIYAQALAGCGNERAPNAADPAA
jgi:lysophosphatidate acyltransferase